VLSDVEVVDYDYFALVTLKGLNWLVTNLELCIREYANYFELLILYLTTSIVCIKVNNSSIKCELFNIKIHRTPYMFRPAVAIIRGIMNIKENFYIYLYKQNTYKDWTR
jgi:hypothetical protein